MSNQEPPRLLDPKFVQTSFIWPTLKHAGYDKTESDLLRAVKEDKSKKLVHYAVLGLREVGTANSIPKLEGLTSYPYNDVKTTAVIAVGSIAGGSETKFYASLLDDPKYKDKLYPMAVIWEVGTKDALKSVVDYGEKLVRGLLKRLPNAVDYQYAIQYLAKYPSNEGNDLIAGLKKHAEAAPAPEIMSAEALEKFKREHATAS